MHGSTTWGPRWLKLVLLEPRLQDYARINVVSLQRRVKAAPKDANRRIFDATTICLSVNVEVRLIFNVPVGFFVEILCSLVFDEHSFLW